VARQVEQVLKRERNYEYVTVTVAWLALLLHIMRPFFQMSDRKQSIYNPQQILGNRS